MANDNYNFQLSFRFDTNDSRTEIWYLDQLPPNESLVSKPVDQAFVDSVTQHGVLTPIWIALLTDRNNDIFVVAGSRRIKAARIAGLETIMAVVREMTTADAIGARSIENNKRSENSLADIQGIEYFLNLDPDLEKHPKVLADALGMNLGRLKKLLPQVRASRLFKDAVRDGHISEETMRKVSNLPPTYLQMAIERFAQRKAKYIQDVAGGKVFKSPPTLLSGSDLVEFQQVRKTEAVASLPLFDTQQPATLASNLLSELGIPGQEIEGYLVVYTQDGVQTIQNYQMYSEEDARSILGELQTNYPNLEDLHLCKVTRID